MMVILRIFGYIKNFHVCFGWVELMVIGRIVHIVSIFWLGKIDGYWQNCSIPLVWLLPPSFRYCIGFANHISL